MESDDWLDTTSAVTADKPLALPAEVTLPDDYRARVAMLEEAWSRLSTKQKLYLTAWRDCRFNGRAACRQLGYSEKSKPHSIWLQEPDYALVVRIWRANAAANALDRDRLLARQDDIVETLLTPKPVLHQGIPVYHEGKVLEEVEAGAASRANETLMKAAGLLKDKDAEINVNLGIVGPALNIQVMPTPPSKAGEARGVTIDALLEPAE